MPVGAYISQLQPAAPVPPIDLLSLFLPMPLMSALVVPPRHDPVSMPAPYVSQFTECHARVLQCIRMPPVSINLPMNQFTAGERVRVEPNVVRSRMEACETR